MTFLWLLFWALAGAPNPRGWWLVTLIVFAWLEVLSSRKSGRS